MAGGRTGWVYFSRPRLRTEVFGMVCPSPEAHSALAVYTLCPGPALFSVVSGLGTDWD